MNSEEIESWVRRNNFVLRSRSPEEIVQWVIKHAQKPIITSNFGPKSASLIHLVNHKMPSIPLIWCDSGYNTSYTYTFARDLTEQLDLNLYTYAPRQTVAQREVWFGGIPDIDDPKHKLFTQQVKLEPFERAMLEHQPDYWFTNVRKGQTAFRDTLDILSVSSKGIIKVSPFYYWSDKELDEYLIKHDLSNESRYFDPTKVLGNRECGLHVS